MWTSTLLALGLSATATLAAPSRDAHAQVNDVGGIVSSILSPVVAPTATGASPQATYIGSSMGGIDSWNAIPFAVPPVATNRLYAPSSISTALGTVQATGMAQACPQQMYSTPNTTLLPPAARKILKELPFLQVPKMQGEDCLTLNIQRPSGTMPGDNLPVLFWIYGGGFEFGSTSSYDASFLISSSVTADAPIMFVAANYRLSGWGFLAGEEVQKAGIANLGLLDQRLALQWVADNIAAFGGDPSKVTIWGESAGSISVFDQMALYNGNHTYKGNPLFRAAIMDSGSIVPANPVNGSKGQATYDAVVAYAGCNGTANTLQCLRELPEAKFAAAATSVPGIFGYNSVALQYLPRPDGIVLAQSPELLVEAGKIAQVPFIVGDQEDEGTLFSLSQANLTTTADLVQYLHTIFFPAVPVSRIKALVATYPNNPSAGSPYGTGPLYEIYPEYKRLAALLGDITFTLTRRIYLELMSIVFPNIPSYSYLASYLDVTPVLGTFHATDLLYAYGDVMLGTPYQTISSYYISFVNTMDPNALAAPSFVPEWPLWSQNHTLVDIGPLSNSYITDDFRNATYAFLTNKKNVLRI